MGAVQEAAKAHLSPRTGLESRPVARNLLLLLVLFPPLYMLEKKVQRFDIAKNTKERSPSELHSYCCKK